MAQVRFSKGSAQVRSCSTGRRSDLDARKLVFAIVDGHRGVRCLVGVDVDHHFMITLLVSFETQGAFLLSDGWCSILF